MTAESLIIQHGQSTRIERPSITPDTGGGQAKTFGLVMYAHVWIQPVSANQPRQYGGESDVVTHDGFCATSIPIRNGDELVQGGQRYKFLGWYNAGNLLGRGISHKVMELSATEGVT
jgi:hypothetical protein